jgi:hypothetical protein
MKRATYFLFALLVLITASCKKEAGPGGKKTITGTVRFLNGTSGSMEVANGATVMICYGTTSQCSTYDQEVVADASGVYHFDGLNKGEYFISAKYTDANGFIYTTAGYSVSAENKKETLTLDIELR